MRPDCAACFCRWHTCSYQDRNRPGRRDACERRSGREELFCRQLPRFRHLRLWDRARRPRRLRRSFRHEPKPSRSRSPCRRQRICALRGCAGASLPESPPWWFCRRHWVRASRKPHRAGSRSRFFSRRGRGRVHRGETGYRRTMRDSKNARVHPRVFGPDLKPRWRNANSIGKAVPPAKLRYFSA